MNGSPSAPVLAVSVALPAISPLARLAALASILALKVPYLDNVTLRETPSHRVEVLLANAVAEEVVPVGGPLTKYPTPEISTEIHSYQ